MATDESSTFRRIYQSAGRPEALPWHREEPPALLTEALEGRTGPGRALDLGCGAGTFSIYLARKGYEVTGVDFTPEALRMAEERARAAGVSVRLVEADVAAWTGGEGFDVVLDSGCLHSLPPAKRATYKQRLLSWLAPAGDYVLVHFGRRHFLDWRPMGPRRQRRAEVVAELGPELREIAYREQFLDVPLPIGPTILIGEYRFRMAAK